MGHQRYSSSARQDVTQFKKICIRICHKLIRKQHCTICVTSSYYIFLSVSRIVRIKGSPGMMLTLLSCIVIKCLSMEKFVDYQLQYMFYFIYLGLQEEYKNISFYILYTSCPWFSFFVLTALENYWNVVLFWWNFLNTFSNFFLSMYCAFSVYFQCTFSFYRCFFVI